MAIATDFLDTNILLYAISRDSSESAKTARAVHLLTQPGWGLSLQVIQEFFYNATVKIERPMTPEEAARFLQPFFRLPLVPVTLGLFEEACRICKRYRISYWDAAIVSAAKELGATTLYSEDLAHGQLYDGVRVVNPFLS
jgi:predicted nucleic acid-binding protein